MQTAPMFGRPLYPFRQLPAWITADTPSCARRMASFIWFWVSSPLRYEISSFSRIPNAFKQTIVTGSTCVISMSPWDTAVEFQKGSLNIYIVSRRTYNIAYICEDTLNYSHKVYAFRCMKNILQFKRETVWWPSTILNMLNDYKFRLVFSF